MAENFIEEISVYKVFRVNRYGINPKTGRTYKIHRVTFDPTKPYPLKPGCYDITLLAIV